MADEDQENSFSLAKDRLFTIVADVMILFYLRPERFPPEWRIRSTAQFSQFQMQSVLASTFLGCSIG